MEYEKSVHSSNLESCKFYSPVYIDIQAGLQLLNPWQISIIENYLLIMMFVTYIPLQRFGYGERVGVFGCGENCPNYHLFSPHFRRAILLSQAELLVWKCYITQILGSALERRGNTTQPQMCWPFSQALLVTYSTVCVILGFRSRNGRLING